MKYVAYCRKSSESEERQVLSIDAQINTINEKALRDGIQLAKVFRESMSAKAPGRPIFNEVLKYVKRNGPCTIYTWKLDRLARNAKDGGELSWLMDEGAIVEIRTYERVIRNTSDDKFLMSLEFGMAKKYVDDLSVNVKRGNQEKLRQGGWPGLAPFGYLNNKADHTVYPDPNLAHYVEQMYRLYATSRYGVKDIEKILYDEGLRSRGGYTVRHSVIHRVLRNPFYSGIMTRDGKYYPAKHQPIVSKELFDQVQKTIEERQHTHKEKHNFVHRGFMRCNVCGCTFTASTKKGFTYYYCTNGKKTCEQHKKYLRDRKVDDMIAGTFASLETDDQLIELAYKAKKERSGQTDSYNQLSVDSVEKQLVNVRQKQQKLLDGYLGELIPEDVYKARTQGLNNEEISLKAQKEKLQKEQPSDPLSTLERVKSIFLDGNKAKRNFLKYRDENKRALLENVLWNVLVENGKVAEASFKMPFELIAKTPNKGDFAVLQAR